MMLCSATGCESLQRKFTRKKPSPTAVNPVTVFKDYTDIVTPADRYHKHALMFDYWNGELMEALDATPLNPKRVGRASTESLTELHRLQQLVVDEVAQQLTPLVEERTRLDRQLQLGTMAASQAYAARRTIEAQQRELHRRFHWRQVQDHLKPNAATD